jgi:hypothetical protein
MKYVSRLQSLVVPDQRYSGFEPIMPAGRLIRPSIVLGRSCCTSASKKTSGRSNLSGTSSRALDTPLRKSVSGNPSISGDLNKLKRLSKSRL